MARTDERTDNAKRYELCLFKAMQQRTVGIDDCKAKHKTSDPGEVDICIAKDSRVQVKVRSLSCSVRTGAESRSPLLSANLVEGKRRKEGNVCKVQSKP